MENPRPDVEPVDLDVQSLAQGLFDLRDALVNLSLHLHDYQFEMDLPKRQITAQQVQQLLEQD